MVFSATSFVNSEELRNTMLIGRLVRPTNKRKLTNTKDDTTLE